MVKQENFEIKLPQFEGPFDLLLFFIERDELNIHEISIAKITDDFLAYIRHLHQMNMEVASEFIFVAASLMRIKAKTLLPRPVDREHETDLQEDLVQKLIEYKAFKAVCEELMQLEEQRMRQEKRGNIAANLRLIDEQSQPGEELATFDLYKLWSNYHRLMELYTKNTVESRHTVVTYPYTIEAQKSAILSLLSINEQLDFALLKKNSQDKVHFVYNFLALLEMLQQQLIAIQTGEGYNQFWVSKLNQ